MGHDLKFLVHCFVISFFFHPLHLLCFKSIAFGYCLKLDIEFSYMSYDLLLLLLLL